MTTRGTSSATSQGRRSRRAHVPATVSASVLILILILILVLVVGAGACAGGGGRSLDTAGTTSSTTTVVRRVGTTGPPEAGPPDAPHGGPVAPTSGSTFSQPCPAAALGSFSMTDEHFRRSYADGLAGPDAHLYELMRTFRVEHVAALQERGVCIGSIGVGISASTGTSLGPSSPHRLVIGIRTDRFTPEAKAEVLATFSDPASVVVEAAPEYHAGMG